MLRFTEEGGAIRFWRSEEEARSQEGARARWEQRALDLFFVAAFVLFGLGIWHGEVIEDWMRWPGIGLLALLLAWVRSSLRRRFAQDAERDGYMLEHRLVPATDAFETSRLVGTEVVRTVRPLRDVRTVTLGYAPTVNDQAPFPPALVFGFPRVGVSDNHLHAEFAMDDKEGAMHAYQRCEAVLAPLYADISWRDRRSVEDRHRWPLDRREVSAPDRSIGMVRRLW